MKVLLFEPMVIWVSPHFETCLELMQRHLDEGDSVSFFGCNGALESCEPNFSHKRARCLQCISKRERGLALLSTAVPHYDFVHLTTADQEECNALRTHFDDIDDLKGYRLADFDIGYAAASSLIHHTKDPAPNMSEHTTAVARLVRSAFVVYQSFINHLQTRHFDRVYIMNGRFAAVRGVLRACQKLGIECVMHERGSTLKRYGLFYNKLPHDLQEFVTKAKTAWQQAPRVQREEIASGFFTERRQGQEQSWFSYTKNQTAGLLPDHWDPSKRNIVIYNSSESELAGIGDEWRNPIYRTQIDGIIALAEEMRSHSNRYHLWLRIHPNLRGIQNDSMTRLAELESSRFHIISAESPISTYELVDAADIIVTFGSTVGIEAAFWGKASVLLGSCFYRDLGSIYTPSSHDEAVKLITAELEPKEHEGALVYGYYLQTFGQPFEYYTPKSVFEGKFKGERIEPSIPSKLSRFLLLLLGNKAGDRALQYLIDACRKQQSLGAALGSSPLAEIGQTERSIS